MLVSVKLKGHALRNAAPEHKVDRKSMQEHKVDRGSCVKTVKQNGYALRYAAQQLFFLHVADPLLHRSRPWGVGTGKETSEAARWLRCYSSIGGRRPWSNSNLSLGIHLGGCPGSHLGGRAFVPGN